MSLSGDDQINGKGFPLPRAETGDQPHRRPRRGRTSSGDPGVPIPVEEQIPLAGNQGPSRQPKQTGRVGIQVQNLASGIRQDPRAIGLVGLHTWHPAPSTTIRASGERGGVFFAIGVRNGTAGDRSTFAFGSPHTSRRLACSTNRPRPRPRRLRGRPHAVRGISIEKG